MLDIYAGVAILHEAKSIKVEKVGGWTNVKMAFALVICSCCMSWLYDRG